MAAKPQKVDFNVFIGIDIGTSGISFGYGLKNGTIKIHNCDNKYQLSNAKINSAILFNDNEKVVSFGKDCFEYYHKNKNAEKLYLINEYIPQLFS